MDDIVSKVASNSAEIAELKKTFQQVSDYPSAMQLEYSSVLQSKTFENAPLLSLILFFT